MAILLRRCMWTNLILLVSPAAASIISVHNHPSGDTTPSRHDFSVTERLESVGKTLGIDVIDHIIVAKEGTKSIREWR